MEKFNVSSNAATLAAPEENEILFTEDYQATDAGRVRRNGTDETMFTATQAADRRSYVEELQDALSRIGRLRGLLSICARCRRVGDGEDNWQEVRWPIARYWESRFNRTFCPDCYEVSIKPESDLLFEYLQGDYESRD